jgi:hypothetical protein
MISMGYIYDFRNFRRLPQNSALMISMGYTYYFRNFRNTLSPFFLEVEFVVSYFR